MDLIRRATIASALVLLAAPLIVVPVRAQMDFSGEWAPVQDEDNVGNPYIGEFVGNPMSRAASLRAQAWDASLYRLPEWQFRPHGATYITRGPRVRAEVRTYTFKTLPDASGWDPTPCWNR